MRVLVTGGAGFIGSHLVDALLLSKHRVAVFDNFSAGSKAAVNARARLYQGDIGDAKAVHRLFAKEKPDAVFHLAAQIDLRKSVSDPIDDARINIVGSLVLLEQCIRSRVRRFIFASTGGALYGDTAFVPTPEIVVPQPSSPYGIAKLTVEHYLRFYHREYGLASLALRYGNVYGPRQDPNGEAGVIAIFVNKMLAGAPVTIHGDGKQTRDYIYIADVVRANLLALKRKVIGALNIGTGKPTSVNEIARTLAEAMEVTAKITHGPAKPGEQRRSALDCRQALRMLGWRPQTSLKDGIAHTLAWYANIQG